MTCTVYVTALTFGRILYYSTLTFWRILCYTDILLYSLFRWRAGIQRIQQHVIVVKNVGIQRLQQNVSGSVVKNAGIQRIQQNVSVVKNVGIQRLQHFAVYYTDILTYSLLHWHFFCILYHTLTRGNSKITTVCCAWYCTDILTYSLLHWHFAVFFTTRWHVGIPAQFTSPATPARTGTKAQVQMYIIHVLVV
jgi:hypothetical protein